MDRRLDRRLVALAAAYAVALNTLLPVAALMLLPAASTALGPAVICSAAGAVRAGSASGVGAPEKPRPPCPCPGACAMAGCAAAVFSPPAGAAIAEMAWSSHRPVVLGREGGDAGTFRLGGRNLARGPPVA